MTAAPAREEDLPHLFEPFWRGGASGATGVGLGLASCRGIAQAHGGTIEAERRAGGGALFRVRLPAGESPPTVAADTGEEARRA